MIRIIPFKSGHLDFITKKSCYDDMADLEERFVRMAGHIDASVFTICCDDRPIAVLGAIIVNKGSMDSFAYIGEEASQHAKSLYIATMHCIEGIQKLYGLRRLSVVVRADYETGQRFVNRLGFKLEGRLEKFGPTGKDYLLYARVW